MSTKLIIAIVSAFIISSCGGTDITTRPMSDEEYQKIATEDAVVNNTLMYAYRVSRKYSQSIPTTFTNERVDGDFGAVTFSGTSSESNSQNILILSSKYTSFDSWLGSISENQGSDTIFIDKDSKQLIEYRTRLRSCVATYASGTGSFIGTIHFSPINISMQTDTTTTLTAKYQITGLMQSSSYSWDVNNNPTTTTTFKK
jgi:hypothetical protein